MSVTKLEKMINPEVMAPMVQATVEAEIKFKPLATIDRTLQGTAGDTVTLPKYAYIGDAEDVGEGEAIPIELLTTSSTSVTVKKAGRGAELTDESLLSGYGDPMGEVVRQLGVSIAQKIDNDVIENLNGISTAMTVGDGSTQLSSDLVADGLVKYGENIDGEKVLFIAPSQLATLRKSEDWIKATDVGVDILIKGTVGMIHGCHVVLSNKIKAVDGKINNFIVKPSALAIYMKRDVLVENERDIIHKTTVITADEHYVTYLADDTKAIKLLAKE